MRLLVRKNLIFQKRRKMYLKNKFVQPRRESRLSHTLQSLPKHPCPLFWVKFSSRLVFARFQFPLHPDCYPVTEKFDCGYNVDDVYKLTWPGLEEDMPTAYQFLKNFQITNNQQTAMVIGKTDEGQTDIEAARAWKDANQDVWKAWIP